MSVIYKRSERDREWETTSSRAGGGSGAGYTTVRRYKVPDHSLEEDTYESEMRLVHRGRDDFDDRRSVNEYVVERDTQPVREVRHYRYAEREPSPVRSEYRIQREYEREYEREPSPARTEIRISRDYERDHEIFPREHQPYELEKYSRSTEYFRPEPQPQPQPQAPPQSIYIRNEAPQPMQMQMQPIIIREEALNLSSFANASRSPHMSWWSVLKKIDRLPGPLAKRKTTTTNAVSRKSTAPVMMTVTKIAGVTGLTTATTTSTSTRKRIHGEARPTPNVTSLQVHLLELLLARSLGIIAKGKVKLLEAVSEMPLATGPWVL
ncbi:hypothetical protein P3342_001132 [Pyrenophora teres f. teres]|nr:hypothetical protein P3342_001132 [Pyrenophora teres f. teres]